MNNTLVIPFIASLSPLERKSAHLWLESPIHNRRKELFSLYKYLSECVHDLKVSPTREQVFRKVFPQQTFDDALLRINCNYLLRCLEDWLAYTHWQDHPSSRHNFLLDAYREKGMAKHFQKASRRAARQLSNAPYRHPEYYMESFQLATTIYRWDSTEGRERPMNLQAQEDALQVALLSYKLRQACLSIAHQQVFAVPYQIAMLEEVLQYAQQAPYAEHAAVAIYYHVYRMYENPLADDTFEAFQALFFMVASQFPWVERRDLLLFGVNFCIRRINQGDAHYGQNALALYRQGLEEGMLLKDGILSTFTYHNITSIALGVGELDWAADFLNSYRPKLAATDRESAYALNLARLSYRRQDYSQALRLLSQTQLRDFIHEMNAKVLQLKIFFILENPQLLSAHLKNTRAYLRRRSATGYHEQVYRNIFQLADQINRLPPYDEDQRKKLRIRIQETQPLAERAWLLELLQ